MQKTYSRYAHLDFLRILSAVMVIGIHCLITITDKTPFRMAAVTNILHNILNFSVPTFIMITGGLLMSSDHRYSYAELFKKYILRAVACIIVFGTAFAFMQLVVETRSISIKTALTAVLYMLTGQSFDHMWYLYMLVGLYIMTPVLKAFLKSSSKRTIECFMLLLFTANYVFPCINTIFDIQIAFTLPIIKWPVFYYIMGYYMMEYAKDLKRPITAVIKIAAAIICIGILSVIGTKYDKLMCIAEQGSPFVAVLAYNVYLLARRYAVKPRKIYKILSPLALGIYIIHPVFIHIFRIAGLSTANYPYLYLPFIILFFILASVCAYVMNKSWHTAIGLIKKLRQNS